MPPVKLYRLTPYLRERIVNLRNNGKTYIDIQNIFMEEEGVQVSRYAIGKFYTRYSVTGTLADPPKARPGKKITDRQLEYIDRKIYQDPEISALELARLLHEVFSNDVSKTTVKRARKILKWKHSQTQYNHMIRDVNKPKRLNHALTCLANNEQFDDVIFTDETTVKIQTTTKYVFRKEGEPARKTPKPKHPYQVHVWGGISRRGATGIYIFTSTMDSIVYQGILEQKLIPFINTVYPNHHRFMQDNDPKHVSRSTKEFMMRHNINHWVTPPESPDMNPIENVWGSMKYFIRRRVKPTNQRELVEGIRTFWNTLTPEICSRYINHLFKVVPKVVEKNGCASGY